MRIRSVLVCLAVAAFSHCRNALDCTAFDAACNPAAWLLYSVPPLLVIGDISPLYGAGSQVSFSRYIKNDSADGTIIGASGTDCDASVSAFRSCFRSGVLFQASSDQTACDPGWTIRDSLGLLNWRCQVDAGAARFISGGFADDTALGDAIDFDQSDWRPLRLEVFDSSGLLLAASPEPQRLWSNAIETANSGLVAGTAQADTIYVISEDSAADYVLDAEGATLAVRPGLTKPVLEPSSKFRPPLFTLRGTLTATAAAPASRSPPGTRRCAERVSQTRLQAPSCCNPKTPSSIT